MREVFLKGRRFDSEKQAVAWAREEISFLEGLTRESHGGGG